MTTEGLMEQTSNTIITREGVQLNTLLDRWTYQTANRSISCNFRMLPSTTPRFQQGFKKALAWYASNRSSATMQNHFQRMSCMLRHISKLKDQPFDTLTAVDLLNYRATLNNERGWYLSSLSGFIKKWHALGLYGISKEAVDLLHKIHLPGNSKGTAVLTADPIYGPYTDLEFQAIQRALEVARTNNFISLENYLLIWLFMLLGQRPGQYALLKVGDVSRIAAVDGSHLYFIRVPRAKQRGLSARESFTNRIIAADIGAPLYGYADKVRVSFTNLLTDANNAPLFASAKEGRATNDFKYHRTSASISRTLDSSLSSLKVYSERTGQPIKISATRFRRTLGTRAAVEGHSEFVIAELLDHCDTQSVGVYVEASPQFVKKIDKSMALSMAPLARAFEGALVKSESERQAVDQITNRITDPRIDGSFSTMGNCGQNAHCKLLAPIACYICSNFRPWLDGPHEAVLDYLLLERERLASASDTRISSINDRSILATAEVIRLCNSVREKVNGALE